MKKYLITAVLLPLFGLSQNSVKKADKLYQHYSYSKVIDRLDGKKDLTIQAHRELAESFKMMADFEKAEQHFALVAADSSRKPEDILAYAQILKNNSKYTQAKEQLDIYAGLKQEENRVAQFQKNPNYLLELMHDQGQFKINHLDMNTAEQEFGAVYAGNKIVFTSSRANIGAAMRKWNGNQMSFLDLYEANIDSSNAELKNIRRSNDVNKKFHEGPASFNQAGTQVFYTRNNYASNSSDGVTKLELFEAFLTDGKWSQGRAFDFNNKEYSVGHPALNSDGTVLYFASDMPGGFGGVDLYKSTKNPDGSWSKPENLGNKINTEGNEEFPFFHNSGLLFFASDGLPGLGGLDQFVCKLNGNDVSKVVNLGLPVNSNKDDFTLVLDSAQKKGYFASNREGGAGSDDIYAFDLLKPFVFGKTIQGIAKTPDGSVLENVVVVLKNVNGDKVASVVTGQDGAYKFDVEDANEYSLSGTLEKYTEGKNTASTKGNENPVIADLQLNKAPTFGLLALVTDQKTGAALKDVKLKITDAKGEIVEFITPENGEYKTGLPTAKIGDVINYKIELSKEGYLSKTVDFKKTIEAPGEMKVHEKLDLSLGKIELGTDIGKLININPIYFDVNKFNIRPDAAKELDKIVKAMNEYPAMVIELGSHTDCRAPMKYNMTLSDKRAKASAAYVISKGISKERIYGKGYGESKLKNDCACEGAVKSTCSEEEHQQNRRTEFIIVKLLDK